ncbi:MAG: glycosyltransferase [Bacteroidaceae bacterium]|nr:glycosyltransferase [Bacteroidaceae bacterium]
MKKIIFYAPLGKNIPSEKIGGAEAGCLKTKKIYEDAGYQIIVLDKPAISRGKLKFLLEMSVVPFKLYALCKKYGNGVPIHIVGFYTKIARFERMLMNIAHFCGNKVIYELRNGSMVLTYKEGSEKYRNILKDLLLKPEVVLCQGMEYVKFIREQWGIERSFYPNYIMDEFIQPNKTIRPHPIRLIYFGRVTESKNVNVIIETLGIIRESGFEATLDIIGGYNQEYKTVLDELAKKLNVADVVTFYGRKPFSFIADKLRSSHYFLFPSTERQEGHSNSLTEAMGCGVVPIVSTAGFNVSICGNDYLVVSDINAEAFAAKVISIENNGKWNEYSESAYNHILKNYTQKIVSKKLINTIDKLYL